MCWFQLRLFCRVHSMYLALLASSSVWPWMVYEDVCGCRLPVIWKTWHFWGWKSMSQSFSHCWSLSKFCWRLRASVSVSMVLYRMQSSANNLAVDSGDMYSGKSLINRTNRRKSRRPNTLPWRTPDWTGADAEVKLLWSVHKEAADPTV